MQILCFSQHYKPESIASAFRISEHALFWAKAGYRVTIFTGYPNYPTGKLYPGYTIKMLSEEWDGDVRVLRSKLLIKDNKSLFHRIQNAMSFFIYGLLNLFIHKKDIGSDYDVVIGSSGPVFCAMLGFLYAKLIRKPFVFELRDISFVQMQAVGMSSSSLGYRLMKAFELFLCRRAERIVVVTRGLKNELLRHHIDAQRIDVITNGVVVDNQVIHPTTDQAHDGLRLGYFGTLGLSQDIPTALGILKTIKERISNLQLTMIGDGAERMQIEALLRIDGMEFVQLLPSMSRLSLDAYYNNVDACVVSLKQAEGFGSALPCKLFHIMQTGKAIIYIGPVGEASELIASHKIGIVLTKNSQCDPRALEELSNPNIKEKLQCMGTNGYRLVQERFNREQLANDYLRILRDLT